MTQAGPGLPKESINKATTTVLQVGLVAAVTGLHCCCPASHQQLRPPAGGGQ
jgi:hypothetical protein